MSVVDSVILGQVRLEPVDFSGSSVRLLVSTQTMQQDGEGNDTEPVFSGEESITLPIKAWESLQQVQVQVAAYLAAFTAPPVAAA